MSNGTKADRRLWLPSKGPETPLNASSFQVRRIGLVGGYGVQPLWADGHSTGIFSCEMLARLAPP